MENSIEYNDYIDFGFCDYIALCSVLGEPKDNTNSFLDYGIIREKGLYDEPKSYQSYR